MVIELLFALRSWLLRFGRFTWRRNGTRFDALLLYPSQPIVERAQSGGKILAEILIALANLLQQCNHLVHVLIGLRGWSVSILTRKIALFAE
jgi:hypothetical protein